MKQLPAPLYFLLFLIGGLLLQLLFPIFWSDELLVTAIGLTLLMIGTWTTVVGVLQLKKHNASIDPTTPPTTLVTDGIYRYTRNPIYAGMLLTYSGFAVLVRSWWLTLLIPVVIYVINRQVITREEFDLSQKFGEKFHQYQSQVKRWI